MDKYQVFVAEDGDLVFDPKSIGTFVDWSAAKAAGRGWLDREGLEIGAASYIALKGSGLTFATWQLQSSDGRVRPMKSPTEATLWAEERR